MHTGIKLYVTNRSVLTALIAVCLPAFGNPTPDALAIVQKALDLNRETDQLQREYNMTQESIKREIGSDGNVRSTESETFEVHVLNGEPIQKLVRKNGQVLTEADARKAQADFDRKLRRLTSESPEARRKRRAEEHEKLSKRREMFQELPAAFDFRVVGEEKMNGHDTWLIEAKPKPGYKPRSMRTTFLTKMEGRFWISKEHNRLVKLNAVTTGPVSFGWGVLAKVAPGTRFDIEQMRLADGVWVTRRFRMAYDVQIALVKQKRGETEQIMWDFRKAPLAASNAGVQ